MGTTKEHFEHVVFLANYLPGTGSSIANWELSHERKNSLRTCRPTICATGTLKDWVIWYLNPKSTSERNIHVCYKTIFDMDNLVVHSRTHAGEKVYKCNVCYRAILGIGNLVVHSKTHAGMNRLLCTICQTTIEGMDNLAAHSKTHTDQRVYKCNICHNTIVGMDNLVAHSRTHIGQTVYKCFRCHKAIVDPYE